ncbi:MAG: hypothetical protein Q7S03_03320 [bacterium]|nr:hypothetical protein [bacterium]
MFKKIISTLSSIFFHLLCLSVIFYSISLIANWYFSKKPADGVDLYLSASYVSDLINHFAWRFNGWKDFWFSGVPYSVDYPSLYFYLMIPFAKFFGLVAGIQRFAILGLGVFSLFSYLLYFELSKNRLLAVVLTLTTILSGNLYKSLFWAGGIPFWTSQAFLPIVLFLIIKYCRTDNRKWLLLAALASGLGINGHLQSLFNFTLPAAVIVLFFWRPNKTTFSFLGRVFDIFIFGLLTYLVGLPYLSALFPLSDLVYLLKFVTAILSQVFAREKYPSLPETQTSTGVSATELWTRAQFNLIFTDTNIFLWIITAFVLFCFVFTFILQKSKGKRLKLLFPFVLLNIYFISLVFLMSRGVSVLIGGWYKAFWPTLVGLGMIAAYLWGETRLILVENNFFELRRKLGSFFNFGLVVFVNLCLLGLISYLLIFVQPKAVANMDRIDSPNGTYPGILAMVNSNVDLSLIKSQITPKIMTDKPKDYRLYANDALVNQWWPTVMDMPLTRGYVDSPYPDRGGIFWLDAALGRGGKDDQSSLISDWETPPEVVDNNIRFLLDWNATKYLEGNQTSSSNAKSTGYLAVNVTTDKFIDTDEEIKIEGEITNEYLPGLIKERWSANGFETMHFYRIKDEIVSPILMATDAVPVLHLGDKDGYDVLTRLLGELNLGPRKIVLVKGPKYLDDIKYEDLQHFPLIIIYKYDYRNRDRVWKILEQYVAKGGNVFVDTGSEGKESDTAWLEGRSSSQLPNIFPIKTTTRKNLGTEWYIDVEDNEITKNINFDEFSPLVFNKTPWSVSYPESDTALRKNAKVILRQQGKIVMAEQRLGGSKVIWSGLNFPYHALRDYNTQEANLFNNILSYLVGTGEGNFTSQTTWVSPRERLIQVNGEKGVLFKEGNFKGWNAALNGRKLTIYEAGPSNPGAMYVRLPEGVTGTLRFYYSGITESKVSHIISLIVIIFIFDYLLGSHLGSRFKKSIPYLDKKDFKNWWNREDE